MKNPGGYYRAFDGSWNFEIFCDYLFSFWTLSSIPAMHPKAEILRKPKPHSSLCQALSSKPHHATCPKPHHATCPKPHHVTSHMPHAPCPSITLCLPNACDLGEAGIMYMCSCPRFGHYHRCKHALAYALFKKESKVPTCFSTATAGKRKAPAGASLSKRSRCLMIDP